MKNLLKTSVFLLLTLFIVSCSDDDDNNGGGEMTQTIADFVAGNDDYSSLLAALERAGLTATLDGTTNFTVFAPDNTAFQTFLDDNGFASLDAVPTDLLTNVLLNHVVNGSVTSTQLSTGYISSLATSAEGANLSMYINTTSGVEINGASTVVAADIEVDNGVIHAVDSVIGLPTITTLAAANSDFSTLVAALGAASLVGTVSAPDANLTVLAPGNAAFSDFLNANGFTGLDDIPADVLSQTLLNHVLGAKVLSTDLSTSYSNTLATYGATANNISLYINTESGVRFNGVSSVAVADVVATNGIIHAVDAVIALPTVVTFATADATFGTLVQALTRADQPDFVSILSTPNGTSPAPFTVFAPTNDAFGALLTELGATSLDDIDGATLTATLNYHVIAEANVRAEDLTNGPVTTLGGDVTIDAGNATITDANGRVSNIIVTNVQAANGVVHAIDTVILPEL